MGIIHINKKTGNLNGMISPNMLTITPAYNNTENIAIIFNSILYLWKILKIIHRKNVMLDNTMLINSRKNPTPSSYPIIAGSKSIRSTNTQLMQFIIDKMRNAFFIIAFNPPHH